MFGRKTAMRTDADQVVGELRATKEHLGSAARGAAHATVGALRGALRGAKDSWQGPATESPPRKSVMARLRESRAAKATAQPAEEHEAVVEPTTDVPEPPQANFHAQREDVRPLVDYFMNSLSGIGEPGKDTAMLEAIDKKRAKEMQKEAKKRASAVASALRGERRRRWPLMAAAFAVGTAVGALASLALRQGGERWTSKDFQEAAQKTKEKLTDATNAIAEKTSSAAQTLANKTNKATDLVKDKAASTSISEKKVLANQSR